MEHVCISELKQLLRYEPETGALLWVSRPPHLNKRGWNTRYADTPALNTRHSDGYRMGKINGVRVYAHRVAWALHTGAWPTGVVDHINGDRSDNRASNLQDVGMRDNALNVRPSIKQSGIPCVFWVEGSKKWRVRKTIDGSRKDFGTYDSLSEAVEALKSIKMPR